MTIFRNTDEAGREQTELSVACSAVIDSRCLVEPVARKLTEEHFHSKFWRSVFFKSIHMYDDGEIVDLTTIQNVLALGDDELKKLIEGLERTPTASNFSTYCSNLIELRNSEILQTETERITCDSRMTAAEMLEALKDIRLQDCETFPVFEPFESDRKDELPAFPVECLPASLSDMVNAAAEAIQAPVDMLAMTALGVASIAVQGKYNARVWPSWTEHICLYLLCIAEPSERKSPSLSIMTEPVRSWEYLHNAALEYDISEYNENLEQLQKQVSLLRKEVLAGKKPNAAERLQQAREDLGHLQDNPVRQLQLIADDSTPEMLAQLISENNGRMAIVSAEGGLFDVMAGMYSDSVVNLDIYTKSYTGEPYIVNRKNGTNIRLRSPSLTVCVMAQQIVLNKIMTDGTLKGKGVLARFLYSIPKSRVGNRKPNGHDIPNNVKNAYNQLITKLLNHDTQNIETIVFSPDATAMIERLHDKLEKMLVTELKWIEAWAGKWLGQIVRIAAIIHCCLYPDAPADKQLEKETVNRAAIIGTYFLRHSECAHLSANLGQSQEETDAKYLWGIIESKQTDTVRELYRASRFHAMANGRKTMQPAIDELVRRGYIRLSKTSSVGRPTEKIIINPEALMPNVP